MTSEPNSATDTDETDLAALRRIAEEGRLAPLFSGRYFVLWGTILAVASLYQYAVMTHLFDAPSWSLALVWFGLSGAGALASVLMGRSLGTNRPAFHLGNRVERIVWTTSGWMFALVALGLFLMAYVAPPPGLEHAFAMFALMPPLTFGVYAIAMNASAVAGEAPFLKSYALVSLAFAAAAAMLAGRVEQLLLFAVGIALVSILPGLALLRREAR